MDHEPFHSYEYSNQLNIQARRPKPAVLNEIKLASDRSNSNDKMNPKKILIIQ